MTEVTGNRTFKTGRVSRRTFLTGSAGVASSTVLMNAIASRAYAAGDETLKVALIGCGGRGTGAATQALSTQGPVKLWAMADLFEDQLEKSLSALTNGQDKRYDRVKHHGFADKIDVPPERRFLGFDAYRKAIDSGVDLVILTCFPHFRAEHFEYAVQQGKNVFMEKPLAVDAPSVRRILAANKLAKQKNLKVSVGLQRHHFLIYEETMKRLRDGAIGTPQLLRCYWNSGGTMTLGPREGLTEMEFQLRNKYLFTWLIGDHIVEQHIHNLDVCNWIMNAHPVHANGMGGRQYRNGREHGQIFDHHFVEFTYADGIKMYSQCRQIPGCWNSVSEHVEGSKGTAELNRGLIESSNGSWRFDGQRTNPYQVEHDVLADAIRQDRAHNEVDYGAESTMTAIMGRMATYSGKQITWDAAFASNLTLAPKRYAFDATPPILPDANGIYPCALPGVTKAL